MPLINWRTVNGPGFVREAISIIERTGPGGVSHAEFVFGSESFGSRSPDGVKYRPLDTYPVDIRFVAPVTAANYSKGMAFLAAQNGKGYDYLADAGIAADRDWRDPDRWMCSELLTAALEQFGVIHAVAGEVNFVTPQDVLVYSSAMGFGA